MNQQQTAYKYYYKSFQGSTLEDERRTAYTIGMVVAYEIGVIPLIPDASEDIKRFFLNIGDGEREYKEIPEDLFKEVFSEAQVKEAIDYGNYRVRGWVRVEYRSVTRHRPKLIEQQDGKCDLCNRPLISSDLSEGNERTIVSRIRPLRNGGSNHISNLMAIHLSCRQKFK